MAVGLRHQDLREPAAKAGSRSAEHACAGVSACPAERHRQQRHRRSPSAKTTARWSPSSRCGRGCAPAASRPPTSPPRPVRRRRRATSRSPIAAPGAEQRQLRPGDDQHADQSDRDRAPAVDADRLAEEDRAEHDDQQRLRIVERDRFGQRQPRQREEAEPHRRDADDAARDVAERPRRCGSAVRSSPRKARNSDDRKHREERAEEHDLAGRQRARPP